MSSLGLQVMHMYVKLNKWTHATPIGNKMILRCQSNLSALELLSAKSSTPYVPNYKML
jgi:hypothetical protein